MWKTKYSALIFPIWIFHLDKNYIAMKKHELVPQSTQVLTGSIRDMGQFLQLSLVSIIQECLS